MSDTTTTAQKIKLRKAMPEGLVFFLRLALVLSCTRSMWMILTADSVSGVAKFLSILTVLGFGIALGFFHPEGSQQDMLTFVGSILGPFIVGFLSMVAFSALPGVVTGYAMWLIILGIIVGVSWSIYIFWFQT